MTIIFPLRMALVPGVGYTAVRRRWWHKMSSSVGHQLCPDITGGVCSSPASLCVSGQASNVRLYIYKLQEPELCCRLGLVRGLPCISERCTLGPDKVTLIGRWQILLLLHLLDQTLDLSLSILYVL